MAITGSMRLWSYQVVRSTSAVHPQSKPLSCGVAAWLDCTQLSRIPESHYPSSSLFPEFPVLRTRMRDVRRGAISALMRAPSN